MGITGTGRRYSQRYGARDPWLAGWARASVYLVWRALFASWRPALFLILIAGALLFGLRTLQSLDLRPPPPPEAERLAASVEASVGDARAWWSAELDRALAPPPGATPDLVLADSLAPALPMLASRERLARSLLLESAASERALEARLRAVPAWRRARLLDAAYTDRLAQASGLAPPALVFAPEATPRRLARARTLYGPAVEAVDAWFSDPAGRALILRGAPGLHDAPPRAALYGDVRDLIIQSCALAEAAGRRVGQCRVVFLPKPDADPLLAGLSLTLPGVDGQARIGARVLKAAVAAGRADRAFLADLVLGADAALAREAILAEAMPLIGDAGEHYTRPVYSEAAAREAARAFERTTRIDTARRDRVFEHMAVLRREVGALGAVRLAAIIRSEEDASRLAALAERHGGQTLALHHALGAGMLTMDTGDAAAPDFRLPNEARFPAMLAGLCLALALGLVLWVGLAGRRRARGGPPGPVERVDGVVTRLILGRNS